MILRHSSLSLAVLGFAVLGFLSRAEATHYKLFVLTGQSNSLGVTNGGEADSSIGFDPADAGIKFAWHNVVSATKSLGDSGGVFTTLQEQQGGFYTGSATHWGPEIDFARSLYRAGVRDFGVIKASRGGGGNTHWSKSLSGHMYSHVVSTVNTATATLTAGGDTFEMPVPASGGTSPPPVVEKGTVNLATCFDGNEIYNGTSYINGWSEVTPAATTESLAGTILNRIHTNGAGEWLEGINSSKDGGATTWNTGNDGDWTYEARLKFNANSPGTWEITVPDSSPQRLCTLHASADLAVSDPWTAVPGQGPIIGTDGDLVLRESTAADERFYRVEVTQP